MLREACKSQSCATVPFRGAFCATRAFRGGSCAKAGRRGICLAGCPISPFLPPWCLPGCRNGPFLPPWCRPGTSLRNAAVEEPGIRGPKLNGPSARVLRRGSCARKASRRGSSATRACTCPNEPFLPPWCLAGCANSPFLPPWCLPGCPNGTFLPPWCLPGASLVPSLVPPYQNDSFLPSRCLLGCPNGPVLPPWCLHAGRCRRGVWTTRAKAQRPEHRVLGLRVIAYSNSAPPGMIPPQG